ncbi:MAG: hypothetical protein WBX38_20535, partial [Candidatus Sulfotelmatobacter sp.]
MKARTFRLFVPLALAAIGVLAVPSHLAPTAKASCVFKNGKTCPPPPPPPPTSGQFGGPLAGLNTTDTNLFNGGYGT